LELPTMRDDNKNTIYTCKQSVKKEKQHGGAHKTTMKKALKNIDPPYLILSSLLHPTALFFLHVPTIHPFPLYFPYFFVGPTPLP